MDKDNIKMQDNKIREILSLSKVKAGDNLKYRIMQQIETESVLSAKRSEGKNLMPMIVNALFTFGSMYVLIVLVAIGVYAMGGIGALNSFTFLAPIIMISLVCSMFWVISICDDKRRFRQAK